MRWRFWRRRPAQPSDDVVNAMERADKELKHSRAQAGRADEAVRQAHEVLRRTGRFTSEIDRALRLRGYP